MTDQYVAPTEMLAGTDVYPRHWNRLVENQKNMNERVEVLEAGTPPEPDYSSFPVGGIIAFYKPAANIPAGWQVCDGTNGTPDLRSMFVYGAANDGELGDGGGVETHIHTNPSTNTGGGHSHSVGGSTSGPSAGVNGVTGGSYQAASAGHTHGANFSTNSQGSHSHTVGNTAAANHLPPYVKLYFIMRIS
jgi:hypothetical protein